MRHLSCQPSPAAGSNAMNRLQTRSAAWIGFFGIRVHTRAFEYDLIWSPAGLPEAANADPVDNRDDAPDHAKRDETAHEPQEFG